MSGAAAVRFCRMRKTSAIVLAQFHESVCVDLNFAGITDVIHLQPDGDFEHLTNEEKLMLDSSPY